jgi:hypothetical protein
MAQKRAGLITQSDGITIEVVAQRACRSAQEWIAWSFSSSYAARPQPLPR